MTSPPVSEHDITAYIDNRLSARRRREVEAYLDQRPSLKEWVQTDIELNAAVSEAVAAVDPGPLPAHLAGALIPQKPSWRWQSLAAGIALLAIGGAAGFVAGKLSPSPTIVAQKTPQWVELATVAHQTFVAEKVHPVEVGADNAAHLSDWLSLRLKKKLTIPNFSGEGFSLMGGRLLSSEAGPTGQLMYANAKGQRVTLYLRPARSRVTRFQLAQSDGVSAFYWVENGLAFAIIGATDKKTLNKLASITYKAF